MIEDDDAGAGRVSLCKCQIGVLSRAERQRPTPTTTGWTPQLELVEQPVFRQRLADATVPVEDDVLAFLRFEVATVATTSPSVR
jgi:hypothetical protein